MGWRSPRRAQDLRDPLARSRGDEGRRARQGRALSPQRFGKQSATPSVAVVGGGIIGLCAAYELRRRGCEVVVLEAGRVGYGASHGNAGWIVPSLSGPLPAAGLTRYALASMRRPDSPLYIAPRADAKLARWLWRFWRRCNDADHLAGLDATIRLNARTFALYDQLAAEGVDFPMWEAGLLFAFLDEAAAHKQLAYLQHLAPYGYEVPEQLLTGAALRDCEPALSTEVVAGVIVGRERHVDPARLCAGLADALRRHGVEVLEHTPVVGFERWGERVTGVRTRDGHLDADAVLLAAGAWTTPLAARLGVAVPMQPGKGYSFELRPSVAPRRPLYFAEAKIAATPLGDRVRIAGTMELSGLNLRLDRRRIRAITIGARRYLADWSEPLARPWAGLRPVPADGQPIIGALPGYTNAFVSTGHAMLGITLGPASGEAVADLIVGQGNAELLAPFQPARLAG